MNNFSRFFLVLVVASLSCSCATAQHSSIGEDDVVEYSSQGVWTKQLIVRDIGKDKYRVWLVVKGKDGSKENVEVFLDKTGTIYLFPAFLADEYVYLEMRWDVVSQKPNIYIVNGKDRAFSTVKINEFGDDVLYRITPWKYFDMR